MLPNLFYEVRISLTPKSNKGSWEKENSRPVLQIWKQKLQK